MIVEELASRSDSFESRYFDHQISHKYLVYLEDGLQIETTAYEHYKNGNPTHLAIDISSMVGCPAGCKFCASSLLQYKRNLTVHEVVNQVRHCVNLNDGNRFSQVTCSFQGIGEPSLVPDLVINSSLQLLSFESNIALSISSLALDPNGLKRIVDSRIPFTNFQMTLCGTTNSKTKKVAPRSRDFDEFILLVKKLSSAKNIKKMKVNYLLIKGVSDSSKDLEVLLNSFSQTRIIVKLSYVNPTKSSNIYGLESVTRERALQFCNKLKENGIDSYVFGPFKDIRMGCGQLLALEDV